MSQFAYLALTSIFLLISIASSAVANWSAFTVACLMVTFVAWLVTLALTAAEVARRR